MINSYYNKGYWSRPLPARVWVRNYDIRVYHHTLYVPFSPSPVCYTCTYFFHLSILLNLSLPMHPVLTLSFSTPTFASFLPPFSPHSHTSPSSHFFPPPLVPLATFCSIIKWRTLGQITATFTHLPLHRTPFFPRL